MQIHEVTIPQALKTPLQTAASAVGKLAGAARGGSTYAQQAPGKIRQAYTQAKTARQAAGVAGKAQTAWETYVKNLQATQQATPDVLETALRAFIQKNLLGDLRYQYNSLTNVNQIESVIKQLIDPANTGKQSELWTQLIRTISVSQAGGAAPGVTGAQPGRRGKQGQAGGSGAVSPASIQKEIENKLGINPQLYKGMGDAVKVLGGSANAGSTGNTVVDAFLRSLGFTVQ